jgi:cold shock CspA family protein
MTEGYGVIAQRAEDVFVHLPPSSEGFGPWRAGGDYVLVEATRGPRLIVMKAPAVL